MMEKEKGHRMECLLNAMKERNEETRSCLTTTELGRQLGMTAREVYRELCRLGILYYGQGKYLPTREYDFRGLMMYRFFIYFSKEGEQKLRMYPVWTTKGVKTMRELITKGRH